MSSSATIHALQQRITEMQPVRLGDQGLPTAAELSALLPDGALRKGTSYAVHGSTALAVALLAEASRSGAWCGIIGLPAVGVESAAKLGVALDRCILIPHPGDQALGIVHTLSEVLTVMLVSPVLTPRPGEAERLSARLRDHGAALIVLGEWPRAAGTLQVTHSQWHGLGDGHGVLAMRELTVRSQDRRGIRHHTLRFTEGHLDTHCPAEQRHGSKPSPEGLRAVPS